MNSQKSLRIRSIMGNSFMKSILSLFVASSVATAGVCPTWVGRPEAYPVGTIVTLSGKNYKVLRLLDNGWIHPTDTWFWTVTTDVCPDPVPPPDPAPPPSGIGSGSGGSFAFSKTSFSGGIPIYMEIDGIPGGVNFAGREGTVEVNQLKHRVYLPTNRDDGTITGTRKHDAITIAKRIDKSSPYLLKFVCEGLTVPSVKFKYYEISDQGEERNHYTITLEKVKVANYHLTNTAWGWTEQIDFRYGKITWNYHEGNIQAADEWNIR